MSTVKKTGSTQKSANGNALSVVKADAKEKTTLAELEKQLKQEQEARKTAETELSKRKGATVADVLVKAEGLKSLSDRLKQLQEKKKELTAFRFASDQMGEAFTLKDSQGNTFGTSNAEALKMVKDGLTRLIDEKIAQTEKKLLEIA